MDLPRGPGPAAAPGLLDLPPLALGLVWPQLDRGSKRALRATCRGGRDLVRASTTQLEVTGSLQQLLELDVSVAAPHLNTFRLQPTEGAMRSWRTGSTADVRYLGQMLAQLPGLRVVDVAVHPSEHNRLLGPPFLRALQPLTQLERLELGVVDPQHLRLLAALSHLTSLKLEAGAVGSGSAPAPNPLLILSALGRIQELQLQPRSNMAVAFPATPSVVLTGLTRLVLPRHDLTTNSWPQLAAAAPALQYLRIQVLEPPPLGCAPLLLVTELSASHWPGVLPCAPINPGSWEVQGWARLGCALPALEGLHLQLPASVADLAKALTCAGLPRLRLAKAGLGRWRSSLSDLPPGRGLLHAGQVEASLHYTSEVASLASFGAATQLKVISMFGEVPIDSLEAIQGLPLQSLELSKLCAASDDLMVLASWRLLRQLKWHAARCDLLTDTNLAPVLANLPQLEVLSLAGPSSRPGDPQRSMTLGLVRAALQHCPLLRELCLDASNGGKGEGRPCQTDEARAIAASLGRHNLQLYVRLSGD